MGDLKNPIATITNNVSVDVDIYDVFNPSNSANAVLTYTKLDTVKQGETKQIQTIHLASQLQAMYTGVIPALNGNYYYQFPVAVMAILAIGSKKQTSYTITDDDKTGMEQSFLFQKYVVANADSQIAKDFFAALNDPDQEKAVNKFFASTKNFKTCTLAKWTAAVSWCSQFTSAWQGPYYLYSVPPKDSSTAPTLIATVNIVSTPTADSAVLALGDPSQNTALSMNGQGLEESNVGEGDISVSLKPAWINLVQTDDQGNTRYLIGNALSGVVNGITVFGTGQARTISNPDDSADQQKKDQQDQKDFDRWFSKITTLISLGVAILTAYFFYKQLKAGETQKTNNSAEEAARKSGGDDDNAVDDAIEKENDDYKESFSDDSGEIPLVRKRVAKVPEETKKAVEEVVKQEKVNKLENVVDDQVEKLSDVLEKKPPTDDIENTAGTLSEVQSDIKDIQDGKPGAKSVEEVKTSLKDVSTTIETQSKADDWKQYEKKALETTKEDIDAGLKQTESIDQAATEKANEAKAEASDPKFEPDFEEPKTEPIETEVVK
jgi:hypothetical protein